MIIMKKKLFSAQNAQNDNLTKDLWSRTWSISFEINIYINRRKKNGIKFNEKRRVWRAWFDPYHKLHRIKFIRELSAHVCSKPTKNTFRNIHTFVCIGCSIHSNHLDWLYRHFVLTDELMENVVTFYHFFSSLISKRWIIIHNNFFGGMFIFFIPAYHNSLTDSRVGSFSNHLIHAHQ